MNTKKLILILAAVTITLLVGCGPALGDTNLLDPVDKKTISSPVPGEESPEAKASLPVVIAAVNDLTEQLDISAGEIEVVEVEAVTWPDASLGCPEPGMFYIQILSPGYRVTLVAEEEEYVYHTDEGETAVSCEEADMANPPGSSPKIDAGLEPLVEQAKEMLAKKLGVEAKEILVIEAHSIVWSDASHGCPEPGMSYLQVPQEGAQIRLYTLKAEFDFHIGEGRGLFLCEASTETNPTSSDSQTQ